MKDVIANQTPPWWVRFGKWAVFLAVNAVVTVTVRQVLISSNILTPLGNAGGEWLKANLALAVWTTALISSLLLTGLLFYLVYRPARQARLGSDSAPPNGGGLAEVRLRSHFLNEMKENLQGRLNASIHRARFIDLQIEDDPQAVETPWVYRDVNRIRTYEDIWEAFTESKRRLLLLGHPGAGKTTALLQIGLRMLAEAELDPAAPLPIFVNLSKFRFSERGARRWVKLPGLPKRSAHLAAEGPLFEEWLIGEAAAIPGIDRATATRWLADNRFAALLDGLDEFRDERRGELARLLNDQFLQKYGPMPVVVCSRINEYSILRDRADTQLQLKGAVQLQPLTDGQVAEYLRAARADGLLEALPNDVCLRELSRTPLTLSMLVLAYGGAAPAARGATGSLSETRFKLFESYVDRMLQRQARRDHQVPFDDVRAKDILPARYRFAPHLVDRWLGWLALMLSVRMRTTFSRGSLVRTLLIGVNWDREPAAYWVSYAAVALLYLLPLALVAATILPPAPGSVALCLSILSLAWLLAPAVVDTPPAREAPILILLAATIVVLLVGVAIFAQATASLLPGENSPVVVAPILIATALGSLLMLEREGRSYGYLILAAAGSAAAAAKIAGDGLDHTAVRLWGETSLGTEYFMAGAAWLALAMVIAVPLFARSAQGLRDLPGFLGLIAVIGAAAFVTTLAVGFLPTQHWVTVMLFLTAGTLLAFGITEADPQGGAHFYWCSVWAAAALTGLISGNAPYVGLAAIVAATLLLLASSLLANESASRSTEPNFWSLQTWDRLFLSSVAWALLALLRRLPSRRRRFLNSAVDAFLLKESRGEYEFVHRLLRDYFALRELVPRLRSGDDLRIETIRSLGYQGEAAVDILLEFADDDDQRVRAAAIEALTHIPSPACSARAAASVDDESLEVRLALIRSLPRLRLPVQASVLLKMKPIAVEAEVGAILDAYPDGGPPTAPPDVEAEIKEPSAPSAPTRHGGLAIAYLERFGMPAVDSLLRIAGETDGFRRYDAEHYLAKHSEPAVTDLLIDRLSSPDQSLKLSIIEILDEREDFKAIGALEALLEDSAELIREAASSAVFSLQTARRILAERKAALSAEGTRVGTPDPAARGSRDPSCIE